MIELVNRSPYHIPRLQKVIEDLVNNCIVCVLTNAGSNKHHGGRHLQGNRPGTYWEVDFTEVKPAQYGNKYLLVFLDIFSGCVKTFPTKREMANVVTKKILEEILPHFGVPNLNGSDNQPAFNSQISQRLARQLGTNRKLHCPYRPQSSGQVERMNKTLKETLTKLTLETSKSDWTALLPYALFRVRNTPGASDLTPFELMFGAPPPIYVNVENRTCPDVSSIPSSHLLAQLKALEIMRKET
jgi:transposase InsO family protein